MVEAGDCGAYRMFFLKLVIDCLNLTCGHDLVMATW